MIKKVELLAPAGDMASLTAAVNAGADAVYLGGKLFGARAFAQNFDNEELIEALHFVHLFGKKLYLTFNTLIKESEYDQILPFLTPLYEQGLDGIIIQDMGLISYLHHAFPMLELHISTQMTVTNWRSARYLYEQGITRIVPARELSLAEIKEIKEKVPVEIEAFVHGAMCYCYSGQCLFSSFLGGRSGNRGKCAQPCRLPYSVTAPGIPKSGEYYPLSLKDLCTIDLIPSLIDAGIDSFKIEGRMKSPEYVAGVTSVYRKYIDLYESGKPCTVAKQDKDMLSHLYIRSNLGDGYYHKHNGSEMVTGSSPSYAGNDENTIALIHDNYCNTNPKLDITAKVEMNPGSPARLTVWAGAVSYSAAGNEVAFAMKRPLNQTDIEKQLLRTGNTHFFIKKHEISLGDNCFYPVGSLNELRRQALEGLENALLQNSFRTVTVEETPDINISDNTVQHTASTCRLSTHRISVSITTVEQFRTFLHGDKTPEGSTSLSNTCVDKIRNRIYVPADLPVTQKLSIAELREAAKQAEIYLSLPRIIRQRDDFYLEALKNILSESCISGVLICNLEELYFMREFFRRKKLISDHNLYLWNRQSEAFLAKEVQEYTAPLELNIRELKAFPHENMELIVYGHMPMMITANCIVKTQHACTQDNNSFRQSLTDRYRKELPVYCNCVHCYNEILNAVPLSLHKDLSIYQKNGFCHFRLCFTKESGEQAAKLLTFYQQLIYKQNGNCVLPIAEYTTGHSTKGAL